MTSAWAFRKAISNLHFDLVVSKLLKITAALSWNWNMLAAPQNFKLKPYIFIPEENLRKERSHGGDCAFFFFTTPLFPLPHLLQSAQQCPAPHPRSPPHGKRSCQPPGSPRRRRGRRDPAVAGRRGRGAAGLDLCQVSGTKREARLCVHGNAFWCRETYLSSLTAYLSQGLSVWWEISQKRGRWSRPWRTAGGASRVPSTKENRERETM